MLPSEDTTKRRRTDERDSNDEPSVKGKISVKKEDKNPEDSMLEDMVKFNKISERDLPCNRITWTP